MAFLMAFDGGVDVDDVADLEERGLHDDVDASAQAQFFGDADGVDDIEFEFLVDDLLLDFDRQGIPYLVGAV